jgi:hypothetical protein
MVERREQKMHNAKWLIPAVLSFLLGVSASAQAQNAVSPGALNLKSTFDNIGVRAPFSGDANQNATVSVRFKRAAEPTWHAAFPPIVDRRASISGRTNPYANEARVSIVGLQSGTSYNVELTWSDPDGGGSVVSGTISTVASVAATTSELWVDAAAPGGGNGSQSSPFNTITAAISAASAGAKIRVRPGSYPPFTISKSGSSTGGYIAIVGENRDTTFINGGSVSNNITVSSGVSYVQVKSLRLKATNYRSVDVGSNAHHIWLEDLYHENVAGTATCSTSLYDAAGVFFNGGTHDSYIVNNQIFSAFLSNCQVAGNAWDQNGGGVDMYGTGAEGGFVVKGNIINGGFRDCIGDGGESWGDGFRDNSDIINNTVTGCKDDGIQMEGEDVNLRIGGNVVDANRGYSTIAMAAHLVGPAYAYRNVLYQHGLSGYCGKLYEGSQGYGFFIHNTCHAIAGSDAFEGSGNPFDNFYNNIIFTMNTCMRNFAATSKADGNLYQCGTYFSNWGGSNYSSVSAFRSATGNEVHGKQGDPLFINVQKQIDATSPAFDAGIMLANFNTPDSAWPYGGTAPDIGAYEVGGSIVQPPAAPTNLRVVVQ